MSTYLIFGVSDIRDADIVDRYAAIGAQSLAGHDFKFLAGPMPGTQLEGATRFDKFVVLEFPTRDKAEAWYHSPAYQDAIKLRTPVSETFAMMIDSAG